MNARGSRTGTDRQSLGRRCAVALLACLFSATPAVASSSCPAELVQTWVPGGDALRLYVHESSAPFATLRQHLTFQPGLFIPRAPDGTPRCTSSAENLVTAQITLLPVGCVAAECDGLRIELEVADSTSIPPTVPLVECEVREDPGSQPPAADCNYEIRCDEAAAAAADGTPIAVACEGGFVNLTSRAQTLGATLSLSSSHVTVGEEVEISVSAPGANLALYRLEGQQGFLEGPDSQPGGYSTVFHLTAVRGGSISLRAVVSYEEALLCHGRAIFTYNAAASNVVALDIDERPGTARLIVDSIEVPAGFPNTTALTATIGVTLTTAGASVNELSNELLPSPGLAIAPRVDGTPDCVVEAGIEADEADFDFFPTRCGGIDCAGVRAHLRRSGPPLPDATRLYRCEVAEVPYPGGSCRYPIACANAHASDANDVPWTTGCVDGEVRFIRAADSIPVVIEAPRTATVGEGIMVRVQTDPAVAFSQYLSLNGVNQGVEPLLEGSDLMSTSGTEAVFSLRAAHPGLARIQAVAQQLRGCGCLNDTFTICGIGSSETLSINICAAEAIGCAGDCDVSGAVTVDELVIGVNLALGLRDASTCPAFDTSRDSEVTVDELLAAVENALTGCD